MNGTKLIATFIGAGLLRPAPGTWGSLAALPVAWALMTLLGPLALIPAAAAVFALGWWATAEETRGKEDHDPAEIVIDEVAGQWIALLAPSAGFWMRGLDSWDFPWPGWLAAFVFFRLFDIWKPGPIGRADRRGTAAGTMIDDLWAGAFAAVATLVAAGLWHGVIAR